jgi:hypothetical protein
MQLIIDKKTGRQWLQGTYWATVWINKRGYGQINIKKHILNDMTLKQGQEILVKLRIPFIRPHVNI